MRPRVVSLAIGAALSTGQPQIFRSGVDAVRVDVQVTQDGRPVPNLTAADFELLDSGVPQAVEVLSLEQQPVDVLFAFDVSSSMSGAPLVALKGAAHAAVGVLAPEDRAALLTFSHRLSLTSTWTSDRRSIAAMIEGTAAAGLTALQDAVFAACALRERARGRMLVLLFSDGMDTVSWLPPLRVLDEARRTDAVFDVVTLPAVSITPPGVRVGPSPPALPLAVTSRWFLREPVLFRQEFLPVLADVTGGDDLVATMPDLRDVFVRIISLFKSRYVLSYEPQHVPSTGWHTVSVRLTRTRGDVRARSGYQR